MKLIVGLVLLAVISLASANMFANFQLMLELQKDKEGLLKGLSSRDFSLTRKSIAEAFDQAALMINSTGFNTNQDAMHCGFQLAELATGILDGELWALAVVDSFAKLQSGFGRGNFRNPGHFRQCIEVYQEMRDPGAGGFFQGTHCTVAMRGIVEDEFEWPLPIITPPPIIDM